MVARAKYTAKSRKSDFNYFIKNYKNLYKKYGHAYIVIKDKNVLGAYKDVDDAINNTKIPLGTYILQECNGKESGYTSYVTSIKNLSVTDTCKHNGKKSSHFQERV